MKELTREYAIPLSMFERAFIAFQRRYVYPRNAGITLLLLVVIGIYVYAALQDPSNTLAYILIVCSAAVICISWFNTRKIRRTLMQSVRELEDDRYELTIRDDVLLLRTILPEPAEQPDEVLDADGEPAEDSDDPNGFNPIFGDKPGEEIPPTEIYFSQNIHIQEKPEFFMLYLQKGMFYVIPKNAYTDEEQKTICALFAEKLGKRFIAAK